MKKSNILIYSLIFIILSVAFYNFFLSDYYIKEEKKTSCLDKEVTIEEAILRYEFFSKLMTEDEIIKTIKKEEILNVPEKCKTFPYVKIIE